MTIPTPCPLTPRELAALRAVAATGIHKLAARQLGITESTMKNHVNSINRKLDTSTWGQAAVMAVERKWLVNVTIDADRSEP